MSHLVKVADLDELPPGKGKTLRVDGHEVTVCNLEGRFVATATAQPHLTGGMFDTSCDMPGHRFDTDVGDSPARLRTDALKYQVIVDDGGVYVVVEEGHVHRGEEPRLPR